MPHLIVEVGIGSQGERTSARLVRGHLLARTSAQPMIELRPLARSAHVLFPSIKIEMSSPIAAFIPYVHPW